MNNKNKDNGNNDSDNNDSYNTNNINKLKKKTVITTLMKIMTISLSKII